MKSGILYFHINWTDVFNSLALIDYYLEKYDELIIITIPQVENIFTYYTKKQKSKYNIRCIF